MACPPSRFRFGPVLLSIDSDLELGALADSAFARVLAERLIDAMIPVVGMKGPANRKMLAGPDNAACAVQTARYQIPETLFWFRTRWSPRNDRSAGTRGTERR